METLEKVLTFKFYYFLEGRGFLVWNFDYATFDHWKFGKAHRFLFPSCLSIQTVSRFFFNGFRIKKKEFSESVHIDTCTDLFKDFVFFGLYDSFATHFAFKLSKLAALILPNIKQMTKPQPGVRASTEPPSCFIYSPYMFFCAVLQADQPKLSAFVLCSVWMSFMGEVFFKVSWRIGSLIRDKDSYTGFIHPLQILKKITILLIPTHQINFDSAPICKMRIVQL